MSNTTTTDKKNASTATPSNKQTDKATDKDLGLDQVQETIDQENEQGFRGTEIDPTDNAAYTVQGVGKGMPTPETDPEAAKTAREATGGAATNVERNAEANKKANEDKS